MKLQQLDIEGFRSLKKVSWRPGDLNVIIGPNASGKSSLLRLLEMISASAEGRLSRYVLESGGMGSLVWDGLAEGIRVEMKTSSSEGLSRGEILSEPYLLDYYLNLQREGSSNTYSVSQERLLGNFNSEIRIDEKYIHIDWIQKHRYLMVEDEIVEPDSETIQPETVLSQSTGIGANKLWSNRFKNTLQAWGTYSDFRTDRKAQIRQSFVTRYEAIVEPDGQNFPSVLHTLYSENRQFEKDINAAMFAAFGEDFDKLIFAPAASQRTELRLRWKSSGLVPSSADLSDGTLRFLFLITVLANPNPPPLIAIDEPETGLHPSMFPIIAEYAANAALRTQVIFTTHSDQFLNAFEDVIPTTTVAKWEEGQTTLQTVDHDELAYWLKNYSLGNLYRSGQLEQMV